MSLELAPDDSELRLQVAADFWRRTVTGAAVSRASRVR
jgi:hypothetical protein